MLGEFDIATEVTRIDAGRFAAQIASGWDIAGNANGGYLIALAGRAMAEATGRPPLSVTAHYLAPGKVGSCEVIVDVLRTGRRTSTATARLISQGREVIAVIGTFGDQGEQGISVIDARPPVLPAIENCIRTKPPAAVGTGFGDRIDVRVRPRDATFRDGTGSGRAEVAGWFAFSDGQSVDAIGLLQVADAFVPVVFQRQEFPIAWAPTLELTVHIRGLPAAGPLRCVFRSRFMQTGMFEEDGEVWDSAGVLVAQSRQLALIPRI